MVISCPAFHTGFCVCVCASDDEDDMEGEVIFFRPDKRGLLGVDISGWARARADQDAQAYVNNCVCVCVCVCVFSSAWGCIVWCVVRAHGRVCLCGGGVGASGKPNSWCSWSVPSNMPVPP